MPENEEKQRYEELKQKVVDRVANLREIMPYVREQRIKDIMTMIDIDLRANFMTRYYLRAGWVKTQVEHLLEDNTYSINEFSVGEVDYDNHVFVDVKPNSGNCLIQYYTVDGYSQKRLTIESLKNGMIDLFGITKFQYNDKFVVINKKDKLMIFRNEINPYETEGSCEWYQSISRFFNDYSENTMNLLWNSGYFEDKNFNQIALF